ncbi:MAG: putative glutamine amidotransferase YafJ [Gammaproteobacteria bacterium]|nr:putative glutamine amidotransferase YafJ [Gammaproteobacteria bacterium]
MCELLGMSANVPTDICFSFSGLMQRGGGTGPHRDGWGIAFYEGRGCRTFHDPSPSVDSEIARLVRNYPIKSHIVVSHIREGNIGEVCLPNTHPFQRELWGQIWTFAHNGQVDRFNDLPLSCYRPVGTTDSEHIFCWLLGEIRENFPTAPPEKTFSEFIADRCRVIGERGVFNMLMSDSRALYGYCSTKMCWITRRAPFGVAHLKDADMTVDFYEVTTPNDIVTVIATDPLTDNETWTKVHLGETIAFQDGLQIP